jgi:hypothetical protein
MSRDARPVYHVSGRRGRGERKWEKKQTAINIRNAKVFGKLARKFSVRMPCLLFHYAFVLIKFIKMNASFHTKFDLL